MVERSKYITPSEVCTPRINKYYPDWFHHHGLKMSSYKDTSSDKLVIGSRAASLTILDQVVDDDLGWFIDWEIKFSSIENAKGRILMSDDSLLAAFGVIDYYIGYFGRWLIERYGGSSAEQGGFIRYQRFLNIPGPGTGHDGNPNISIELNEEITQNVKELFEAKRPDSLIV